MGKLRESPTEPLVENKELVNSKCFLRRRLGNPSYSFSRSFVPSYTDTSGRPPKPQWTCDSRKPIRRIGLSFNLLLHPSMFKLLSILDRPMS